MPVLLEDLATDFSGRYTKCGVCGTMRSLLALRKKGFTSCCIERTMEVIVPQPKYLVDDNRMVVNLETLDA